MKLNEVFKLLEENKNPKGITNWINKNKLQEEVENESNS